MTRTFATVVVAAVGFAALVHTQRQSLSFTVDQANRGRATYMQHCQSCHGIELIDNPLGPNLKGIEFRQNWFGRTADALFTATAAMPPASPGSLGEDKYVELVAFLLSVNGFPPSGDALPDRRMLTSVLIPWVPPVAGAELSSGARVTAPAARANPLDAITPVTDAMLANPPAGEWLTWRRTWDSHGFSPLNQISKSNVNRLRLRWIWSLPNGPNEGTPLVHDGVIFVHGYGDRVQALDVTTGDLLWQYSRPPVPASGPTVKRSLAIYQDKVYVGTSDARVVALSVATGRPVWDRPLLKNARAVTITGGPLAAKGKVMIGVAGTGASGNFIVGLDSATGAEVWRVNTIARPGEPGGDSWNGLPIEKRTGASVYIPGSYDAALNLAFFGTAQTYDTEALRSQNAAGMSSDALYTDSTLAINPDTGKLVWHFQHQPNDQWDLDWALERLVVKLPSNPRPLVATAGKIGIYDILEAETGRYVFSIDLGLQDIVLGIDPKTGAKRIDEKKLPSGTTKLTACPHAGGAKSWTPESYNSSTRTLFVPLNEACMDLVPVTGRSMLSGLRWQVRPRPDGDGKYGRIAAVNLESRAVTWTYRQRSPIVSGVLATAGGLVFAGSLDRTFTAHDDANGRELWRVRLNDVPNAAPITFMTGGKQYVALTVGNGGPLTRSFTMLVPELKNPTESSAALYVFELADR